VSTSLRNSLAGPTSRAFEKRRPLSKRTLALRLLERGLVKHDTKAERGWKGVRLRIATDPSDGGGWETETDGDQPVTDRDAISQVSPHERRLDH
jgi:hypothetical protein